MKSIYWFGLLGIASFQVSFINPCFAQSSNIVPDNTLGNESSQVTENFQGLPVEVIRGGARRGINLFHSFREFNVSEGRGAYFFSPNAEIQNILARVTGNNRSDILGTLGTFGSSQPNLFLINPNGIVFGKNASLDVRGSFVGSTADSIKFADGNFFSATDNQETPLLTISVPVGLQFGSNPGKITVRGNGHNLTYDPSTFATIRGDVPALQVQSGKTLAFVGGDIALEGGNLKAESGRIELGSVAEPGLVSINQNNSGLTLGYSGIENFGDIQLSQKASVDASGERGGSIQVQSRGLSVKDGSSILSITSGAKPGGDFTVNATESVELIGESADGNYASSLLTESQGAGTSGNLTVNTGKLTTTDGAYVSTYIASSGNGGNLTVKAFDSVELSGRGIFESGLYTGTSFGSSGNAGELKVETGNLIVKNRATVFGNSAGLGNGGDVLIQASNRVFVSNATIISGARSASSGNIDINAASVFLLDGARFQTSTQSSTGGNAGNVTVSAKDTVFLDFSDILSTVQAGGISKGGKIDINAATFSLRDGAQIRTDTQPGGKGDAGNVNVKVTGEVDIAGVRNGFSSGIISSVDTGTEGNGGNIIIDAGSFKLQDGAIIRASTFGQGDAGNVTITVKDDISLADNASIFSTVGAGGVGKGGNIGINGASLTIGDGAQLVTVTRGASNTQPPGRGDAGNVNVKVTGEVNIAGVRNGIFSRVETGTQGNGGNITIDAGFFKLRDGAKIQSSTFGQGNAGNVTLAAKDNVSFVGNASIFSTVEAGSVGKGGNIDINAASLSIQDGAQLTSSTSGQGDAGNVTVTVKDSIFLSDNGILTTVEPGGVGKGGNIDINAASLFLQDGAQLVTVTRSASDTQPAGRGDAGNVNVKVTGEVDIAGEKNGFSSLIFSSVETGTEGNGGNITIDAGSFKLQDGTQLATSTLGQGNAGNVTVSAKDNVSLVGNATIFSTVEAGGMGKGGNIDINAANLSLRDGGQLVTTTRGASDAQPAGRGNAGNVSVKVTGEVDITGEKNGFSSGILSRVDTGTEGNGGNITIDAGSFKLRNGALFDARTENNNRGGNITVNANVFETLNGGQFTTTTSSNGRAGKITVNATDKVIISGNDPNFNDRVANFPNRVANIGPNSGFFVSSTGSGITGDIEINSPKITLDNQGKLNAESASGDGGNINLTVSDLLLMRRGSQITTNAGTEQKGGDGGNIGINSKFIVAIPKENSDITANAFTGTGGNVEITSQGIFGIEPRTQQTDKSDITASSELGVPGNINLATPDNSSIQNSLDDLPDNQIDTNALIANSCIARTSNQNSTFLITGKGGISIRPDDAPLPNYSTGSIRSLPTSTSRRPWKIGDPIVEPTGVYKLPNGKLILSRECS
ncbi:MAG: S-layer family protein [Calothrix sp. MO_192.B10]|nr:S-layer family protein [Calothrix sp. MO_192.B10]